MENNQIALLAGEGALPEIVANRLSQKGILTIIIVLQGNIERFNSIQTILKESPPGKIKNILNILQYHNINEVLMIGKINKQAFLERKGFDLKALKLLKKLKNGKDISIFNIILKELKSIGVNVIPQNKYIKEMIACNGILTRANPKEEEKKDALYGMEHAKKLATMDIGQTIVVKNKIIVAVEAVEGTNETIRRGAHLCKEGSVVCKAARENQDNRFDIPVIGLETLKIMAENSSTLLALEANKILIVNIEQVINYADSKKISIMGI